ncbi:MAG: GLUG motif-containing protein, partial [Candidatus Omnitrophica bacterium]|nr:GLUG motif-containing protein [Candidatus Omnitrophota bacterium]
MRRTFALVVVFFFAVWSVLPGPAFAFNVSRTEGDATITREGDTTTITLGGRAVFEGDTSILAHETVRIVGSSETLLRDMTGSRTDWLGKLLSEGAVILVNTHGVYIAQTANVNVASLIASTLDIQNELFMAGNFSFQKIEGLDPAKILNEADITAREGGYLILLSETIENRGTLTAYMGSVALGVVEKATISFDPGGLVNLVITEGLAREIKDSQGNSVDAIKNTGNLVADGGKVQVTARLLGAALDQLVNNEGVIRATRVVERGGVVELVSDGDIRLAAEGTLEATDATVTSGTRIIVETGTRIDTEHAELDAPRVELTGEGKQSFHGDMVIHNFFYKTGPRNLESSEYPESIFFDPGRTYTFTDSLHIEGFSGGYNIVLLGSSVRGDPWFVNVAAPDPYLTMIGVSDSMNIGPKELYATPSSDFGGNTGWRLNTVYWTGAVNNLWSNAGNWAGGSPVTGQDLVFDSIHGQNKVSNVDGAAYTVDSLNVDDSWKGTITLFTDLEVTDDGGFTLGTDSTLNETQAYTGGTAYVLEATNPVWDGTRNQDVFRVTDASEVAGIEAKDLDAKYVLTQDINLSGILNFDPIGASGAEFTGYFSGAGYTLSNLTIDRSTTDDVGLFGATSGAILEDVDLTNVDITGQDRVGGFVGYSNNYSTIDNVYSSGSVTGGFWVGGLVGDSTYSTIDNSYSAASVTGDQRVGGLVGNNFHSFIIDSHATGDVLGTNGRVGGLVGWGYYSSVDNSYATGDVSGADEVGGLVGYNDVSSFIDNSYATGNVTGTNYVGGLVGSAYASTITDSYATGSVTGVDEVGGLVGDNYGGSSIDNCYSSGYVTGDTNVGGLVGSQAGSTTTNSFWDTETSGQSSSAGEETGKTTAEMMTETTFTEDPSLTAPWTFDSTHWGIVEGETYPYLAALHTGTPHGISGVAYSNQGVTPIDPSLDLDVQIAMAVNGTNLDSVRPGANGFYYFLLENAQLSEGAAVLTYMTDYAKEGNTVTLAGMAGVTDLNIFGDTLIVRHENAGPIANTDLEAAKGVLSTGILYQIDSGTKAFTTAASLYVPAGNTYIPGADVAVGVNLTNAGTITMGSGTLTLTGATVDNTGGILNIAGGTVTGFPTAIAGTVNYTAARDVPVSDYATLNLTGAGDYTAAGSIEADILTLLATNTFTFSALEDLHINTTLTNPGTITMGSGTLTLTGATVDNTGGILNIAGGTVTGFPAAIAGTVNYTAARDVPVSDYATLNLTGAGDYTAAGSIEADILTLLATNTFTFSALEDLHVNTTLTNPGTITMRSGTLTQTGAT